MTDTSECTGNSTLARTAITNNTIATKVVMKDSGNLAVCYATQESGGDEEKDYSQLDAVFIQQAGGIFTPRRMVTGELNY